MKYYSENLKKVFDTVEELNKAEAALKSKEEEKIALSNEIKSLRETIDKLTEELEDKKQRYDKLTSKPVGHISASKDGKPVLDEDIFDDGSPFDFYRLLNMLR